jgi:hypothetical protein
MTHPFLENTAKTIQYILLWLGYALVQIFVLYSIVALPLWCIALDGFIHALVYGALALLLWSIVQYGNYAVLNIQQRLINYIALALLTILIWLGVGYGTFYLLFDSKTTSLLIPLLPIRGFIGLLIYLLIIQRFRFVFEMAESRQNQDYSVESIEEIKQEKPVNVELLERIAVKSGSKIHVILVPDIVYLQADGDYVQIVTVDGKYLKEQTMKFFEEHLPDNQFVRVHRSVIVNVEMISRIELYEKHNQLLTLKNGQKIKTSTSGYKALRATLNL